MKTLLINIDYRDNTGKFWFDSYIKNKTVNFNPEEKSIHKLIAEICEDEGMTLTYNAKPQDNVYVYNKDGESKIVGYMYRGKSEIYDRNMTKPQMAFFDVWVNISEVANFEFEEII
jgi:hypothetical protein